MMLHSEGRMMPRQTPQFTSNGCWSRKVSRVSDGTRTRCIAGSTRTG
jgi:hypothetical protein